MRVLNINNTVKNVQYLDLTGFMGNSGWQELRNEPISGNCINTGFPRTKKSGVIWCNTIFCPQTLDFTGKTRTRGDRIRKMNLSLEPVYFQGFHARKSVV